jgi:hypothetical protein
MTNAQTGLAMLIRTTAVELDPGTDPPVHPAAELFPLMEGQELAELAKDIAEHSLLEPICLYQGAILDGRNRLQACRMAGASPRYQEVHLNGKSPTLFVVSRNLYRRQLNQTQRSTIAAEMVPILEKEAKERQREGGVHGGRIAGSGRPNNRVPARAPEPYSPKETKEFRGETRYKAGEATGVSPRTVQSAIFVKKNNPELFAKMQRGEIPARTAERLARASAAAAEAKAGGQAVPASGKRHQIRQQAARRRMIEVVSQIRGMCRGVKEMNIPLIAAALSPEEKRAFAAIGRETSLVMRDFARALEAQS